MNFNKAHVINRIIERFLNINQILIVMKTISIFLSLFLIISCSTKEKTEDSKGVNPMSVSSKDDFFPKYLSSENKIEINTDIKNDIQLKSGSVIHIEPNIFVDQTGIPIKGKVEITWEEFHSLGEVIASNISMKYDSIGKTFDFETGGMFSIKGSQKRSPIFISKGKKIRIDIASTNDEKNMNFYSYDTIKKTWSYITTKGNTSIKDIKSRQVNPSSVLSKNILDIKLNTTEFPELNSKEIVGWKSRDSMNTEVEKILSTLDIKSKIVSKIDDTTYNLNLSYSNKSFERDFTFAVNPYTFKQAREESFLKKLIAKRNQKELSDYQKNIAEGKVIRSIDIKEFGTYNWDRIQDDQNNIMVKSNFKFPSELDPNLISIHFVCPEEKMTIKCSQSENSIVKFNPKKRNLLIAIDSKNKLLCCKSDQFFKAIKSNNKSFTFTFEKTKFIVSQSNDLDEVIHNLID